MSFLWGRPRRPSPGPDLSQRWVRDSSWASQSSLDFTGAAGKEADNVHLGVAGAIFVTTESLHMTIKIG